MLQIDNAISPPKLGEEASRDRLALSLLSHATRIG